MARRSNQSILKEISPGCSLEGLMPKLKLQYFGHLMQRTDSLEKTLLLGKTGVSSSHQVAKVLELQLQHQSSNEYSGLISFRIDWFDLLAVQGTLKNLL